LHEGSWWPAWHAWLATHSGRRVSARPRPAKASLGKAPGSYVLQR
jgi:polyhydroxyalkanoate synthase